MTIIGCLAIQQEYKVSSFPRKRGPIRRGPLCVNGWSTALFVTNAGGYGSLLSQGQQQGTLLLPPPRGRRGVDDVVGFLAPAQNFHRQHRMIEALQVQIVD